MALDTAVAALEHCGIAWLSQSCDRTGALIL